MAKMGRPTNDPKTYSMGIRLNTKCGKILEKYSEKHGIKRNKTIEIALLLLAEKDGIDVE